MNSPYYTLEMSETDDGTEYPSEALWVPASPEAEREGFLNHQGLLIAGIVDNDEVPTEFVAIGHAHTWTELVDAATAYMRRFFGTNDLYSYPGDPEPAVLPRMPLPMRRHAVFLRHPNPDHPCSCEWDGSWRVAYVPATEPGAIAVITLRHPAAKKRGAA